MKLWAKSLVDKKSFIYDLWQEQRAKEEEGEGTGARRISVYSDSSDPESIHYRDWGILPPWGERDTESSRGRREPRKTDSPEVENKSKQELKMEKCGGPWWQELFDLHVPLYGKCVWMLMLRYSVCRTQGGTSKTTGQKSSLPGTRAWFRWSAFCRDVASQCCVQNWLSCVWVWQQCERMLLLVWLWAWAKKLDSLQWG